MSRILRVGVGLLVIALVAFGCSWDYPVWPKSKKSDTPLFRFVTDERGGAGYIDANGRIVIPPTLVHFGNYGDDDFFDGLVNFDTLRNWECFDADTGKDSAREIREYFIPDFSNWKDHDKYQAEFQRLLNDLTTKSELKANA